MTTFSIAGLQLALPNADNRDEIEAQLARLMKTFPWVQMVLLAELASFGPDKASAEEMPGETESWYRRLAKQYGIWLIPGSIYQKTDAGIFNTAPVINPQGEIVARYQKLYPFQPYEHGVEKGERPVVFDVPGVGRFGLLICYDQWFPEVARALACEGAEVILHPTMTNTIDRGCELILSRANAIANQCYFLSVNNAGDIGNGQSIFVEPEGEVLHQAGALAEMIPITVNFEYLRRVREDGTMGLGQVLKSFRDAKVQYNCYAKDRQLPFLDSLGELTTKKCG